MLKVIGIIVVALLIAVAVVLVLASTKPDRFHVQRMASIMVPA
jgi:hypothetical protein